jgi:serine/threonine protein kinase
MSETFLNNRYRLTLNLGAGGFGETFIGEDTQMPSLRPCVIKKLKPINNNPEVYKLVKQRFEREAAILEQLGESHDQIPSLYAYFTENNHFYLVQELIKGKTLKQLLKEQGILTENQVKNILVDLLNVLDYVHTQGIIHRDIKPENIIVREKDNKPVLIDFGAVRETMGTTITAGGSTSSSIIIGTPGFMSGEQAAGHAIFSSDLYSLGLTAIYLLTGKLPQNLPVDLDSSEILWHDYLSDDVQSNLINIIDKAIKNNPRDRYHNAKDMLAALKSDHTVATANSNITNNSLTPQVESNNSNNQEATQNNTVEIKINFNYEKKWIIITGLLGVITLILAAIAIFYPKKSLLLSQVFPSYKSNILSPAQAFIPCPGNTQLLLLGETPNYQFAICGENKKPVYYIGSNKNGKGEIKVRYSEAGFVYGVNLFLPPSYENTNIENPTLRVFEGGKSILNEKVILLYKLE